MHAICLCVDLNKCLFYADFSWIILIAYQFADLLIGGVLMLCLPTSKNST